MSMRCAVAALAILACAAPVMATWNGQWDCSWKGVPSSGTSDLDVKFNFASLSAPNGHLANSYLGGVGLNQNYTYQFSFCHTLSNDAVPSMCAATSTGPRPDPASPHNKHTQPAAAFQYDPETGGKCHRLGGMTESTRTISYIDESDPVKGIQIQFTGGDEGDTSCRDSDNNPIARSMTVQLPCGDRSINTEFYVVEGHDGNKANCGYTLNFGANHAGCPVTCGISDQKICGGHGYCAVDTDAKQPQCFCNEGFSGDACQSAKVANEDMDGSGSSCDGTCVALIFVFLFLLVGFAGVLLVLWRVRKLENVDKNFRQLQEDFDIDQAGPVDVRGSLN